MKIHYTVETKHRPTFTATKEVKNKYHLENTIRQLKQENKKAGYMKYSNFKIR